MKRNKFLVGAGACVLLCAVALSNIGISSVHAADTERAVDRLGKDLTPVGAERAGNADGLIPEWTGGYQGQPEGYAPGIPFFDIFPEDKVQFTITRDNAAQYADRLTAGELALLDKVPNFRMPVFQSRRSCGFDQEIYDAFAANARTAKLVDNGNTVTGSRITSPFPIPNNGLEVMWNHLLRRSGYKMKGGVASAAVNRDGSYSLVRSYMEMINHYSGPSTPALEDLSDGVLSIVFVEAVAPPSRAGELVLNYSPINRQKDPRQLWVYAPGERRVRRAPDVGYDTPAANTDGQITDDQLDGFNGAPDRYEWDLRGKKEIYIPYNSYRIHSHGLKYSDFLIPGTVNPDYMRYELHRNWVVEAKLKKGESHIYPRRIFYFDEDGWSMSTSESYDDNDELWRVNYMGLMHFYGIPACLSTIIVNHDLRNGRYVALDLDNEEEAFDWYADELTDDMFTASQLRRRGTR